MTLLVEHYKYKKLDRVQLSQGRYYVVGQGRPLPSVTTVLSATADKQFLEDWRKRVGPDEADAILNESLIIGRNLHENLERYVLGDPKRTGPLMAKLLTKLIIRKGMQNVTEVWGTEVPLYYPHLYAGTADLIAIHSNDEAVLDFKNSRAVKREEWLEDYFCQTVAYADAHNKLYGSNIRKGVIMMGTRDGQYDEFIIEGKKFQLYSDKWFARLETYYETYGIE